jgi:hypothetical protein
MGAWSFIRSQLGDSVTCAARPESGSPAAGSSIRHKREQDELLTRAVTIWPSN